MEEILPRHFEDNFVLDSDDHRLGIAGVMLRLRTASGKGWITWKGAPVAHPMLKIREEIEVEVGEVQGLLRIFQGIGFRTVFRYQKYRTVFHVSFPDGSHLAAMFDETPIGSFLELEGEEAAIQQALRCLNIPEERTTSASYGALHREYCARRGIPFGDMTFELSSGREVVQPR